jgi:hypothetical protein
MSGFKIHNPSSGRTDSCHTQSHGHTYILTRTTMALVTITGYPSSGKSTRASQIKAYLDTKLAADEYDGPKLTVEILSDDGLNLPRSAYNGARLAALASWPSVVTIAAKILAQRNLLGAPSSLPCSVKWPLTRFSSSTPSTTSRASDIKCIAPRGR